jgi:two-component system, OmpR family, sensor histidine kinase ChvG
MILRLEAPLPFHRRVPTIARSLVARLVLLVLIFAAVPLVLYEQLSTADTIRQRFLIETLREKGLLIGRAMTPTLSRADEMPYIRLSEELTRYAVGTITLRLLYRPVAVPDSLAFFYVAASPAVSGEAFEAERRQLADFGTLQRLADSCAGDISVAHRIHLPGGGTELLTSITPVQTVGGCWALLASNKLGELGESDLGLPFWQSEQVRLAAAIYLALALVVLLVFVSLWRSLVRFRRQARAVREGLAIADFSRRNDVPELAPVAAEFDRMVASLNETADSIRRAAEDTAHAFKTPLGVIRQALEPLKRRAVAQDKRVVSALRAIESALGKLDSLVQTARQLDRVTADSLDPPRELIDVTALCWAVVDGYNHDLAGPIPIIDAEIEDKLRIMGGGDLLETAVENVVANALSFTPTGQRVRLASRRQGRRVIITVDDEGPGVPPEDVPRIFERYYSHRADGVGPMVGDTHAHDGIGLWITRRNVEAMGGRVHAENRPQGGFRLTIELPALQG